MLQWTLNKSCLISDFLFAESLFFELQISYSTDYKKDLNGKVMLSKYSNPLQNNLSLTGYIKGLAS